MAVPIQTLNNLGPVRSLFRPRGAPRDPSRPEQRCKFLKAPHSGRTDAADGHAELTGQASIIWAIPAQKELAEHFLTLGAEVGQFLSYGLEFFLVGQGVCSRLIHVREVPGQVEFPIELATHPPSLAVRGRHQPRHHPIGLPELFEVLDGNEENRLVHVVGVCITEAVSIRHGIDQARILADESIPRIRLAALAGLQQVACVD